MKKVENHCSAGWQSHKIQGSRVPQSSSGGKPLTTTKTWPVVFVLYSIFRSFCNGSSVCSNHYQSLSDLKKMHRQVGYKGQRKCQRFGKIMARNGKRRYLGTGARTILWLQLENINLYVLPIGMSVHFPSIIHKPRCRRTKGRLISSHRLFPHLLRLKMILTMSWVPRSPIKRNIVLGGYTVLCIQCLSKFSIMGGNCWTKG